MDPRFLRAYTPPQAAFRFLAYDRPLMAEARRVLSPPSRTDAPFAVSLRVMKDKDGVTLSKSAYGWVSTKLSVLNYELPFPSSTRWQAQAQALSPLALGLTSNEHLAEDILAHLPKPDTDTHTETLHFYGHFVITAAGAALMRDMAVQAVGRDGGGAAIFPILSPSPQAHARVAQVHDLQQAIQHFLSFDDQVRAAHPDYQYKLSGYLEV